MTDLRDRLVELLGDEPPAPHDIDRIVVAGRRARRRRNAALAAAGTFGAAGLTAAVVIPVMSAGGNEASVSVAVQPTPTPTPTPTAGQCYLISAPPQAAKRDLTRLLHSGKVGAKADVTQLPSRKHGNSTLLQVCSQGAAPQGSSDDQQPPAGPPYRYTEKPDAIATRLGAHLRDQVTGLGLDITYTRPFAQESSNLDKGHPSYFDGNVDVHEASGYADIGVQVTHETTEPVPFTGDCTPDSHCEETKLPDGSVLRTGQVKAGRGDVVLTAEVHRPDGVVVQAQESNYPFGPQAGSQPHGDQPLTLDQLVSLAEDPDFTF
jgi:hypothetical protein